MLKCNIDRKNQGVEVQAEGTAREIVEDTLILLDEILCAIKRKDRESAETCKMVLVKFMLDSNSPLNKEE